MVLTHAAIGLQGAIIAVYSLVTLTDIVGCSKVVASVTSKLITIANSFCPLMTPVVNTVKAFMANSSASSGVLFTGLRTRMTGRLNVAKRDAFFNVRNNRRG